MNTCLLHTTYNVLVGNDPGELEEELLSQVKETATVGVALIGSGRMGAYHGATLAQRLPGARLAAVADPAPGAAEKLAGALGAGAAYTDPAQVFADPAVDAVVIAAPA